jgi:hypothetical protein
MRPTVVLSLVSALLLAGCTSVPAVWPLSEPVSKPTNYPSAPSTTCAKGLPTQTGTTPEQNLYCAQQDAVDTGSAFSNEQRTLEAVKNGEVLALFGLGTAAGVQTVATKSTTPVKNIGLAAVSLLGLSTAVGLDGQRTAYEAGATAVACLIQVDASLDDAKKALPTGRSLAAVEILSTDLAVHANLFDARRQLTSTILSATSATTKGNEAAAVISSSAATLALDSLAHTQTAAEEDTQLRAAIAAATDPRTRANSLSTALNQIKTAVADQLYKNVDVTKIYDAAKNGYQSLAGKIPSTQQSTKKATINASGAGLSIVNALGAQVSGVQSNIAVASAALAKATADAAAAQKTADTYDSCVGKATPPKPSPNPTPPTS